MAPEPRGSRRNTRLMIAEGLLHLLSSVRPLSSAFKEALENEMIDLSLPKGHYLLEEKSICNHLFYLHSGFAVSFSYTETAKQIEWLWKPGEVVFSAISFFRQVPSDEFIQLIDDSQVSRISHTSLIGLGRDFPEALGACFSLFAGWAEQAEGRLHDLQHLGAPTRFEKMVGTYPRVEQLLSQENIASYLNIAPQSLSRLKRRQRGKGH